jgi:hypothetical protein
LKIVRQRKTKHENKPSKKKQASQLKRRRGKIDTIDIKNKREKKRGRGKGRNKKKVFIKTRKITNTKGKENTSKKQKL